VWRFCCLAKADANVTTARHCRVVLADPHTTRSSSRRSLRMLGVLAGSSGLASLVRDRPSNRSLLELLSTTKCQETGRIFQLQISISHRWATVTTLCVSTFTTAQHGGQQGKLVALLSPSPTTCEGQLMQRLLGRHGELAIYATALRCVGVLRLHERTVWTSL
jgi:hypothetical protein